MSRCGHHSTVRYRPEGFELRCERCLFWWPLDLEFWSPRNSMKTCVACLRELDRMAPRKRATYTDEQRAERSEARKAKYRAMRGDPAWVARERERNREWARRARSAA